MSDIVVAGIAETVDSRTIANSSSRGVSGDENRRLLMQAANKSDTRTDHHTQVSCIDMLPKVVGQQLEQQEQIT